jgi:hypothetical protein
MSIKQDPFSIAFIVIFVKISDGDFVSRIQYLISKGIMKISPPPKAEKPQSPGY